AALSGARRRKGAFMSSYRGCGGTAPGSMRRAAVAATVLAGGLCASPGAAAQAQANAASNPDSAPAADAALSEVVVTAQRRSETLLSVPIAVSALSGDELVRQGITRPASLASI